MVVTEQGGDPACWADEAFWGGFHYRPMSAQDDRLASRVTDVFVDAFAEAALLRQPDRVAIGAQLELEVGTNAQGDRAIQVGFMFAGSRPGAEWDGTRDAAEALVDDIARQIADSLSLDSHEDDDWREAFDLRT